MFVWYVIWGKIVLKDKSVEELREVFRKWNLSKLSYIFDRDSEQYKQQSDIKLPDRDLFKFTVDKQDEITHFVKDYIHLLSMPIWSLNRDALKSLNVELAAKYREITLLRKMNEWDLWRRDLDDILFELEKVEKNELSIQRKTMEK